MCKTGRTDRQTDRWTPDRCMTLIARDAASVIRNHSTSWFIVVCPRPRHMHQVHRCELSLVTSIRSVHGLFVRVLVTTVSPVKTAELIEMSFEL